jgi:hypothetical protein
VNVLERLRARRRWIATELLAGAGTAILVGVAVWLFLQAVR